MLNTLLIAAIGVAVAVPALTHSAPVGGWVGSSALTQMQPANIPTWHPNYANRFPGCAASLPGVIPSSLLVVRLSGTVAPMPFDEAWRRTHNHKHADDVWTVGACR